MTCPQTRPTGIKNIGGRLSKNIPEPKWFADPTYKDKCVAGAFFDLVKANKKMTKLDALRLKKYYSYFIKQNRTKTTEYLQEHDMSPLHHIFDDHYLYDPSWCYTQKVEVSPNFEEYLLQCNRRKVQNWMREHLYSQKANAKAKEREYTKLRMEVD